MQRPTPSDGTVVVPLTRPQRLPAPLHRHAGQVRQIRRDQQPTEEYRRVPITVTPDHDDPLTLEADYGPSPAMRAALAQQRIDYRRHLRRMNHIKEARAAVWLVVALVCLFAVTTVTALVVGSMLGQWHIPVTNP